MAIPTKILIGFPCYAVFDDDCRNPVLFKGSNTGEIGIATFTTEETLREYRQQTGKVWPLIRFDWAGQILLYADTLPQNITGLWVDPTKENTGAWVSMDQIMEHFQKTERV